MERIGQQGEGGCDENSEGRKRIRRQGKERRGQEGGH